MVKKSIDIVVFISRRRVEVEDSRKVVFKELDNGIVVEVEYGA